MRRRILGVIAKLCAFLPTVFWGLLIYGFDAPYAANITLLSAALHELGHVTALVLLRKGGTIPRGAVNGFRIRYGVELSYRDEVIVAAAGPLFNIAAGLLSLCISGGEYFRSFALINFLTAGSNLLPCEGLDGYRIVRALLSHTTARDDFPALATVGAFFNILIMLSSLFLMMRIGEGYWIYGLFLCNSVASLENLRKRRTF